MRTAEPGAASALTFWKALHHSTWSSRRGCLLALAPLYRGCQGRRSPQQGTASCLPQIHVLLSLRKKPQFLNGQQRELLRENLLGPHGTSPLA